METEKWPKAADSALQYDVSNKFVHNKVDKKSVSYSAVHYTILSHKRPCTTISYQSRD